MVDIWERHIGGIKMYRGFHSIKVLCKGWLLSSYLNTKIYITLSTASE